MTLQIVPRQVQDLVGGAMPPEWLDAFWETENLMLNGKSPREVWELGDHEEVLNFMTATKVSAE